MNCQGQCVVCPAPDCLPHNPLHRLFRESLFRSLRPLCYLLRHLAGLWEEGNSERSQLFWAGCCRSACGELPHRNVFIVFYLPGMTLIDFSHK